MEVKPGYKRTGLGVIPEDWNVHRLSEVVDFLDGRRRPVKDTDRAKMRGDVPYYGASGVVDYVNDYIFDDDLVLLGEDGENILSRNSRLAFRVSGKVWVNNHAHVLKPKDGNHIGYLADFLESLNYEQYNTGTAQPKLNKQVCSSIPVVTPPLPEQRAIATALSDVDALLAKLDQLIAKKRDLKQGAMEQLLTGQTRLPGFSGPWKVKRLGEIASLRRENVIPANFPEDVFIHFSLPAFDLGKTPVAEIGAAIGSNKFHVPEGAVLVSKLNPRIPRVWAPVDVPRQAIASTEFLVLMPQENVSRGFLFVFCSSPYFCEQMELAATGTTGSHQRISPLEALGIAISLPVDTQEQTAIATVLSDMDAEIATLEARRDKTRDIKQGMMQELLTGRIRLV